MDLQLNRCKCNRNTLPEDQFLYLFTTGWKSGKEHKIEIWFVYHGGKYYVMAENREHAHWVQNLIRNPRISFVVGGKSFAGNAKVIEKGSRIGIIKKLMMQKYGWDAGLIVGLGP